MRFHVYNLNINNDFLAGIYINSMHIFLSGFIAEATLKYDVKLYGSIKSDKNSFYNNFIFYMRSKFFLVDVFFNSTKNNKFSRERDLIVVFGYNPLIVMQLIILKFFGFKTICYIFDSHKLNLVENNFKSRIIDLYYKFGFFLARFLDVIVCVNPKFKNEYNKLFSNIVESKIGYSFNSRSLEYKGVSCNVFESNCINVIYGGTLNEDNGAHLILELIRKKFPFDIKFIVYGFGDLADKFNKESKVNNKLKFVGKQPNSNIKYLVNKADICIHLRDPNSINKNIAFPSKLIEYLFNSKVVITNDFPALENEMKQAMVNVCSFTVEDMYNFLLVFEKTNDVIFDKNSIPCALEKIRENYHWEKVFNDLESKINSIK